MILKLSDRYGLEVHSGVEHTDSIEGRGKHEITLQGWQWQRIHDRSWGTTTFQDQEKAGGIGKCDTEAKGERREVGSPQAREGLKEEEIKSQMFTRDQVREMKVSVKVSSEGAAGGLNKSSFTDWQNWVLKVNEKKEKAIPKDWKKKPKWI